MKYLVIILSVFILTSCALTERRFNKLIQKGLDKGYIDTTHKHIDTLINAIDTTGLYKKIKEGISPIEKYIETLKDTCYNKKGKVVGTKIDTKKLKEKLQESKNKLDSVLIKEIFTCLKHPIFFKKNGVTVEVFQDSLGRFDIKIDVGKQNVINLPQSKSWFTRNISDVWGYLFIIAGLIIVILIRR